MVAGPNPCVRRIKVPGVVTTMMDAPMEQILPPGTKTVRECNRCHGKGAVTVRDDYGKPLMIWGSPMRTKCSGCHGEGVVDV